MRRPSTLLRLTRATVGLVTVWCLGCSSYESILGSFFGTPARAMTACSGETSTTSAKAAPTAGASGKPVASVLAMNDTSSFDCGCGGSCYAPSPDLPAMSAPKAVIQIALQLAPSAPVSVTRTPLLPPPEFAV
jgi:hypothetical protein